jgi:hypothetical protein
MFKKKMFIIIFSFLILFSKAQDTTSNTVKDSANVNAVRIPATFAEGSKAWSNLIYRRLHPDVTIRNNAPAGIYVVIVSF